MNDWINQKVSELKKIVKTKNLKIDDAKNAILNILWDSSLAERMKISDELEKQSTNLDGIETHNLYFMLPFIIKEYISMTEEERAEFMKTVNNFKQTENVDNNTNPWNWSNDPTIEPNSVLVDNNWSKTELESSEIEESQNKNDRIDKMNSNISWLWVIKPIKLEKSDYLKWKNIDIWEWVVSDGWDDMHLIINWDNLSELLYTIDGNTLFRDNDWRLFVIAKVWKNSYLPFYRSSEGTSWKQKWTWYPFFGQTDNWIVKWRTKKSIDWFGVDSIKETFDNLNKNLKIPSIFFLTNWKSLPLVKEKLWQELDLNEFIKFSYKNTDPKYKSMSNSEFKNIITWFYPNWEKIKHPEDAKSSEDKKFRNSWIFNIVNDIAENENKVEEQKKNKLSETIEVWNIKAPRVWFWLRTIWSWGADELAAIKAIGSAITNWYRNFDTAQEYWNEKFLWDMIELSKIPRNEFFITTKISPSKENFPDRNISKESFYDSVANWSLKDLKMDYVDLLLLHSPINNKDIENNSLDAMIQLWEEWKVKNIWVSNFDVEELKRANEYVKNKTWWKLSISCNQIEVNCLMKDKKTFEDVKKYADENDILVTWYSPLWMPKDLSDHFKTQTILENNIVKEISKKYDITPHQLALAYVLNKWIMVLPSSTKLKNQKWNLKNVFDIKISSEDIKKLDSIASNESARTRNVEYFNDWIK
jgi:diketogulonate reductase-like aldo/keto reductase